MIFSPKPIERYIAALRSTVQGSVLKNGIKRHNRQRLKKIIAVEALTLRRELDSVNITGFADSLLGAAQIVAMQKGKGFKVRLSGNGNYKVNRRLLTALMLELVYCNANAIGIESGAPRTVIRAAGLSDTGMVLKLARAMGGGYMLEKQSGNIIIRIPTPKTEIIPEKTENEWYYLLDEFSPVNIWLK